MRTFDVAIIGGGIIGSSIAFELAEHKFRVVLLDRCEPGREASWAAGGILSPAPDSPVAIPLVPLGRVSLELYPGFIAAVEEATGCAVGFRQEGTLEAFFTGDAERELSTLIALHHGLGLPTQALPIDKALRLEPALNRVAVAAALMAHEASVDNRALTAAVLTAASRCGADIRTHTEVTALVTEAGRCAGVVAGGETIFAEYTVVAAGCYSGEIEGLRIYAPTRPVRGQMVALQMSKASLRRVVRSERGYVVPRNSASPQTLIAGSTLENVGFEKGVTPAGLGQIFRAALELVPDLADAPILDTWSGLRPDTPDHLPALGPADIPGLVVATGHYRNGILLAPITAKLICELLTEQRTSLPIEPFSPMRFLTAQQRAAW